MIKYFSNNEPFVLVLIPLLVAGHLVLDIYFPSFEMLAVGQENLWDFDFKLIPALYARTGAFVFVCLNAFLINYVFNTHEFYERNNYLPSLIYILLVFLFPMSLRLGEDLIGHTFFILSINKLFDIKQNEDARHMTFLSGLFIGLAITFLPVYIYFILFIWLGTLTIRPFVLRETLLPLFGAIIPLMWIWLIDQHFYQSFIEFDSSLDYSKFGNILIFIPHVIVLLLIIVANKNIIDRRAKSSIRYKRILGLVIYTLLYSILVGGVILAFFETYFYFTIGAVILSIILPYAYLGSKHKWFPAGLLYLLLILNVVKFLY
tara:strand:+ start:216646 stop:217599 length:954 start_codon:yes stop_codon:yes gene_type:complete